MDVIKEAYHVATAEIGHLNILEKSNSSLWEGSWGGAEQFLSLISG